jgi:hypothetical protein
MCCGLDEADGLHEGVLDGDGDIWTGVALAQVGQLTEVCLAELAGCVADGELEHFCSRRCVGQADVYSPLETAADGRVELPGDICCAENEHATWVLTYTVHLNEQLGFDTSRCFRLAFASGTAESVDFVDEDDGRLVLTSHAEQLFYQSVID